MEEESLCGRRPLGLGRGELKWFRSAPITQDARQAGSSTVPVQVGIVAGLAFEDGRSSERLETITDPREDTVNGRRVVRIEAIIDDDIAMRIAVPDVTRIVRWVVEMPPGQTGNRIFTGRAVPNGIADSGVAR